MAAPQHANDQDCQVLGGEDSNSFLCIPSTSQRSTASKAAAKSSACPSKGAKASKVAEKCALKRQKALERQIAKAKEAARGSRQGLSFQEKSIFSHPSEPVRDFKLAVS